ncbi:MAG: efflux RND transporter periplasmic adaptor subunit [Verrucomicrobia bacterium]|nr:efflux RND transporter periplasmic adaptor subunit [Verrucomicrobiota bacterium]MBV8486631.1 efflux RND transporter periplasmic adaptor subunit [Verrucomicrobiota bacterium]MBV8596763.1 efflux RND transporter periplasmic adaptor subunit [Candidatus Eremiobacteraeota bacterium]
MNFSKGAPWLAIGAVLFSGCNEKKDATAAAPPPPVIVATVEPRNVPIFNEWIGRLDGSANVDVRARVQGYVQEIAFNEGTVVNEGDLLVRIDARPYEAALAQAQAQLAQAEADQQKTDQEEQRQTDLFNKKAASDRDYRNAVQANLAGKATVDARHAAVDEAQLNLEFATIKSPIKGIVGRTTFTVGNFVPAGGGGTEITTISTVDPIELRFGASEQEYLGSAEGISEELAKPLEQRDQDFELIRADGKVHPYKGRLLAADRAVDPNTGTIRITAIFPNPGNVLRPGQYARVRLKVQDRTGALLVAQRAVVEMQGKYFVWAVDDTNKASMRSVTPGPRIGSDWLIDTGLKPGDRVVVEGLQMLTEGGSVQPTTALANASPAPASE